MKILVLNWRDIRCPQAGGAEIHLHEIFRRIVSWGHEVTLLSCGFINSSKEEIVDGIRTIRTGSWRNANFAIPLYYMRKLRKEKFDVIVDDINKIPFFAPVYAKAPVLALVPHLFGKAAFSEVSFPVATYVYSWEKLIPFVYSKTPFVAISESTRDDLVDSGIPQNLISVVHCGIDHEKYCPGDLPKFDTPTIVHLGRFRKYKGIHTILKAMVLVKKDIPNARLILIGDGQELPNLKILAQKLNLQDCTTFTGFVSEEEKIQHLRQAHLLVNASAKEGWGLTNIEANACGTPAVATDVPGYKDSVIHGQTGLLIEHDNTEAMARGITQCLSQATFLEELSHQTVEWAQKFNWDKTAEGTFKAIEEAAG